MRVRERVALGSPLGCDGVDASFDDGIKGFFAQGLEALGFCVGEVLGVGWHD